MKKILFTAALLVCGAVSAQPNAAPMPMQPMMNVLSLSTSATQEVAQDTLQITLATSRDGLEAAAVQAQLKQAVDQALAAIKPEVQAPLLEVRTGNFSLYPRYDRQGKINGWQGSAEVVMEGKDFARLSSAAGKVQSLTVQGVAFSLSRAARLEIESQVQAEAIAAFQTKATQMAKGFGFAGYTLREVNVSSADQQFFPRQRNMEMQMAKAASMDAAVPAEAGKTSVSVTVSGAVQLK